MQSRVHLAVVDVVGQRHRPVRGIFIGSQFVPPGARQGGAVGVTLGQPAVPGLPPLVKGAQVLEEVAEIALVDHRKPGQGRLVGVAALRVGIHMIEQGSAELLPVLVCAGVDRHQDFERVHRHFAVAVDPDLAPRHAPGDKQVGGQVDAAFDERGHEVVELIELLRVERGRWTLALGQFALVMVEAQGVVAQPDKTVRQPIGFRFRDEVRAETEVHAVEPTWRPFRTFEGKVTVLVHDHPPMPARGRIDKTHRREVQSGAGLDVQIRLERNPVPAGGQGDRGRGFRGVEGQGG